MVTVAEEMQRAGMTMPLLIGGATTSRAHTALRIEPAYDGPVIHVLDASRAVGVASALVSDGPQRAELIAGTAADYEALRDVARRPRHAGSASPSPRRAPTASPPTPPASRRRRSSPGSTRSANGRCAT